MLKFFLVPQVYVGRVQNFANFTFPIMLEHKNFSNDPCHINSWLLLTLNQIGQSVTRKAQKLKTDNSTVLDWLKRWN